MSALNGFKVAVLATDGFEESELTEPVKALKDAGATVHVLTPEGNDIQGFRHFEKGSIVAANGSLEDTDPNEYDALMLPGGALNADKLRMDHNARRFVMMFDREMKPMAAICHAPWLLISSGVVKDRNLSAYHTIQDDIRNAGGHWRDEETVRDGNLVTSRQPSDLPAFNKAMIKLFAAAAARHPKELKV